MKTRIVLAVASFGILLTAFLLWRLGGEVRGHNRAAYEASLASPGSAAAAPTGGLPSASAPENQGSEAPANAQISATVLPADADFQKWIGEEAKQVDQTHLNSEQKRQELAKVIAEINPAKARQLMQTALNPASTAGEKILSTYLLVEGGTRSRQELQQFITAPMAYSGPQPTHSENEMRAVQERSQKVMAIDGLISQVEKDPSALEALAQTVAALRDPYIRSYAEKRLSETKSHK